MNFLIKNGIVYDPSTHQTEKKDIALEDGVITQPNTQNKYNQVINAEGCIVTPGLIDYHMHCYNHGCDNGINADCNTFCCGITTAVDGGSCGVAGYEKFHQSVVAQSDTRIVSYLLLSSGGQACEAYPENMNPECFEEKRILKLFSKYHGELVGLKLRLSQNIVSTDLAKAVVKRSVEIAATAGTRVIVHVTDCSLPLDNLASLLRAGDVICHIYQGKRNTCLDNKGKVLQGLWEAKKRGVLFDVGNGCNNYDLEVCRAALSQGFTPDIISSDNNTIGSFIQPLHSLPRVLSKFLDMGMSWEDVLDTATISPAKLINRPDLGTMQWGSVGDVCILRKKVKQISYIDCAGHLFQGSQILVPMMTFKDGVAVYCQADFN